MTENLSTNVEGCSSLSPMFKNTALEGLKTDLSNFFSDYYTVNHQHPTPEGNSLLLDREDALAALDSYSHKIEVPMQYQTPIFTAFKHYLSTRAPGGETRGLYHDKTTTYKEASELVQGIFYQYAENDPKFKNNMKIFGRLNGEEDDNYIPVITPEPSTQLVSFSKAILDSLNSSFNDMMRSVNNAPPWSLYVSAINHVKTPWLDKMALMTKLKSLIDTYGDKSDKTRQTLRKSAIDFLFNSTRNPTNDCLTPFVNTLSEFHKKKIGEEWLITSEWPNPLLNRLSLHVSQKKDIKTALQDTQGHALFTQLNDMFKGRNKENSQWVPISDEATDSIFNLIESQIRFVEYENTEDETDQVETDDDEPYEPVYTETRRFIDPDFLLPTVIAVILGTEDDTWSYNPVADMATKQSGDTISSESNGYGLADLMITEPGPLHT